MANPVNPNQQNLNPQKAKNPQNRDHEQHNQAEVQRSNVQPAKNQGKPQDRSDGSRR